MNEVLLVALMISLACVVFSIWSRIRYTYISRKRKEEGVSFEVFQDAFSDDTSEGMLYTVYNHFSEMVKPPIPVLPRDDLGEMYGVVGDDIYDEMCEIATKCGLIPPSKESTVGVSTIADVVRLLQSLKGQYSTLNKSPAE